MRELLRATAARHQHPDSPQIKSSSTGSSAARSSSSAPGTGRVGVNPLTALGRLRSGNQVLLNQHRARSIASPSEEPGGVAATIPVKLSALHTPGILGHRRTSLQRSLPQAAGPVIKSGANTPRTSRSAAHFSRTLEPALLAVRRGRTGVCARRFECLPPRPSRGWPASCRSGLPSS